MKTPHEISMSYRVESAPAYLDAKGILLAMIEALYSGYPLPKGMKATWSIRGAAHDFEALNAAKNPGLKKLIERRLLRDLEAL